jgi:hypothetical protein
MFLGLLVKRSAFALGFLLLLFIMELIIGASLNDTYFAFISDYTPLNAMSGLIEEPFSRFDAVKTAAKTLEADILSDYSVKLTNIITVLVWTGVFVFGSYKLLKKRDL